jgi:hypothetical protein
MPSYRCWSCHELTGGRDVLEVRKEPRRLAGLKPERTWRARVVCRACATAEFERYDAEVKARWDEGRRAARGVPDKAPVRLGDILGRVKTGAELLPPRVLPELGNDTT